VAAAGGVEDAVIAPSTDNAPDTPQGTMAANMQQGPLPLEMLQMLGLYNPKKAPNALVASDAARVGEFYLSEKVMLDNPPVFTTEVAPVHADYIPESVPGCEFLFKCSDNTLRSFPEEQPPQNGDCKIVYEYVPDGFPASFVVSQTASIPDTAKEAGAKYGVDEAIVTGRCNTDLGQIWMVRKGTHTLFEMLDMAKQEEATIVKVIRLVAWVLLCMGWIFLFDPFLTALEVLPLLSQIGYFAVVLAALIVSCLCCLTVMLLAYMRYRPVLTGGLLVVALGIWGIVAWRLNIAVEEGGDTDAPTSAPTSPPTLRGGS
jgi:hypothetical protein